MSKLYYAAMCGCLVLMVPILALSLLESVPIAGLICNLILGLIAIKFGNMAEKAAIEAMCQRLYQGLR